MKVSTDTLRVAFEVWAVQSNPPYKLERAPDPFVYAWSSTACAWEAFEAGAAHAVAQIKAREITDAEIDALVNVIRATGYVTWNQARGIADAVVLANRRGET